MVWSILIHLELSLRPELWLMDAEMAIVKDGVVQVRVKDALVKQVEMELPGQAVRNAWMKTGFEWF